MANYDLTYEGSRVQGILDTGNSLKDAGYIFRGEATPSTVPGTPTERVAYIGGPGTYTNFGSSITVGAGCICVFKYTGSAWSNQVINTGLDSAVNTLQSAITAINNNIGNGYVYAGVATPSTSPVTGKVFYLAVQAGTYTNFGNAVVTAGLNVIKYNGSAWSVDQVIAIDAEPTQGSANLVKSGGVLNSIIQNGPAFDLSAYNAQGGVLATYADLSAALTALNALPADFKKGGMSMKYVQTSDNKYVQWRLMADSFNTNTENWAIAEEGVYVENPEFVYVKTDVEGKILWAIKTDGGIYYGAGVPQQVIDYIEEKLADFSPDEYSDIVAFLADLEKGDETLQDLLNGKVDKVEGESLIDAGVAEIEVRAETPEYISIELDAEEKILSYRNPDGSKVEKCDTLFDSLSLTPNGMNKLQQDLIDAGFNPGGDIPTKTSQLQNDSGFIGASQIPSAVGSVIQGNNNPVTSNGVYNAIQAAQIQAADVTIKTGLPFVAVASADAPQAIKEVCQYVCDGVDDQVEINAAIQSVRSTGGKIFLTRGKFRLSSPIIFQGCSELCGESAGAHFVNDPLTRTIITGTQLQAVENIDIIHVIDGRGLSIHDICLSGIGSAKADNTGWGIKIMGWQDLGNFYNLSITDCAVAFGNNVYTDVFTLHDCSIQKNKMAIMLYKGCGCSIYNNIFCENYGMTTFTGMFSDTASIDGAAKKTFDIYSVIAIINSPAVNIHDNWIYRCGFALNFGEDAEVHPWINWNDIQPISGISIIGTSNNITIKNNNFNQTLASAIRLFERSGDERVVDIYTNDFFIFGSGHGKFTNPIYDEDDMHVSAVVLASPITLGSISYNRFLDKTGYSKYAVYEEDDYPTPGRIANHSVAITCNVMWNLRAETANKCKIVAGSTNVLINNNTTN